jgi:hypothetical protein
MPVKDGHGVTAFEQRISGRYAGDAGTDNGNMGQGFLRLP